MADVLHPAQLVARRRAVRKARARRIRRIIITMLSTGGLTYGGWAIAHSSLFALDGVDIQGARNVARADVLAAGHIRLGMNLLSVDPGAIAGRLKTIPFVASAKVERIYPSKIRVVITERKPIAVVETSSGRWMLDSFGVVIAEAPVGIRGLAAIRSTDPAPFQIGVTATDAGALAALQVWQSLPSALRAKTTSVSAAGDGAISVDLSGVNIVFGGSTRIEDKVTSLQSVLENAKRAGKTVVSVDVSAPDRPAARFR